MSRTQRMKERAIAKSRERKYNNIPFELDWFVKWTATICILVSTFARAAGPQFRIIDLMFGTVGLTCWLAVSLLWKDKALVLLNGVSATLIASTVIREW